MHHLKLIIEPPPWHIRIIIVLLILTFGPVLFLGKLGFKIRQFFRK